MAHQGDDIGDADVPERMADGSTTYHYANGAEHREGIAAFLAKRPARFTGR